MRVTSKKISEAGAGGRWQQHRGRQRRRRREWDNLKPHRGATEHRLDGRQAGGGPNRAGVCGDGEDDVSEGVRTGAPPPPHPLSHGGCGGGLVDS